MYGYIYLTTNLINGKIYVGQHKAEKFENSYKGSGTLLRRAFKEYGEENFKVELLEWCETFEHANSKERYWESYYGLPNFEIGYNITKGGQDKTFEGCHHRESTKKLMSEKHKDIEFSEERCKKISQNKTGIPQSEEANREKKPIFKRNLC